MTRPDRPEHRGTGKDAPVARIVCISTDVDASASLQDLVSAMLPGARVEAADTSIVRGAPTADAVVLAVGTMYSMAHSLVYEMRARGFDGAIIVVAESSVPLASAGLSRFGVGAVLAYEELLERLPAAIVQAIERTSRAPGSPGSPQREALLAVLRRTQGMLSAGMIAATLQHRLNNPLAALLAEAQLLELESLDPEHASSVRRIVELCRRVIEVSRAIDGISGISGTTGITGITGAGGAESTDGIDGTTGSDSGRE